MHEIYDPIPVIFVTEGNVTTPVPDYSSLELQIDKLRLHLGAAIARIRKYHGNVELPRVQISVANIHDLRSPFAILVNGTGQYRHFEDAWDFINDIFYGMNAVYETQKLNDLDQKS